MTQIYHITGMTCSGCVDSVTNKLSKVKGVETVSVSLDNSEAVIEMKNLISVSEFRSVLPKKYAIEKKDNVIKAAGLAENNTTKSKWKQLQPLYIIFMYLFGATVLLNFKDWNLQQAMLDFMGLFYIVFSFFKLIDLNGFPKSFQMYDPLAKVVPVYGWVYPFIELALGLLFLFRFQILIALVATVIILGVTTFGVTKSLLNKKQIQCACLGTALKLPMTQATFIENAIMLVMAGWMLIQMI